MRLALTALVATLALAGCSGPKAGQAMPDVKLVAADGAPVSPDQNKGKVVLYVFSGIGCSPCDQLAPYVRKIRSDFPASQVVVYDCNVWDDTLTGAKQLEDHSGVTSVQGGKAIHDWLGIRYIPSFAVMDGQGRLSAFKDGVDSPDELVSAIKGALATKG
jgi:thiol-disulfide isomerase/thioredoxin